MNSDDGQDSEESQRFEHRVVTTKVNGLSLRYGM